MPFHCSRLAFSYRSRRPSFTDAVVPRVGGVVAGEEGVDVVHRGAARSRVSVHAQILQPGRLAVPDDPVNAVMLGATLHDDGCGASRSRGTCGRGRCNAPPGWGWGTATLSPYHPPPGDAPHRHAGTRPGATLYANGGPLSRRAEVARQCMTMVAARGAASWLSNGRHSHGAIGAASWIFERDNRHTVAPFSVGAVLGGVAERVHGSPCRRTPQLRSASHTFQQKFQS